MPVVGKYAKLLKVKNYRFTTGNGLNGANEVWGPTRTVGAHNIRIKAKCKKRV